MAFNIDIRFIKYKEQHYSSVDFKMHFGFWQQGKKDRVRQTHELEKERTKMCIKDKREIKVETHKKMIEKRECFQ